MQAKDFEAINSAEFWTNSALEKGKVKRDFDVQFESYTDAIAYRKEMMEAEILRDIVLRNVAKNFGYPVRSYADIRLVLRHKPFWNSNEKTKKHNCIGMPCVRCKVCGTRSSDRSVDDFIKARSRHHSTKQAANVETSNWHRCGSDDPDEVEFTERCAISSLIPGHKYESLRQTGAVITATGRWFICLTTGYMHHCVPNGVCPRTTLELCDGCPLSYSCSLTGLAQIPVKESWVAWDGVHFYSASKIHTILNDIANQKLTLADDVYGGEMDYMENVEELTDIEEVDEFELGAVKKRKSPRTQTEEQELDEERKRKIPFEALNEESTTRVKRTKLSVDGEVDTAPDLDLEFELELERLFDDSETKTENQPSKPLQEPVENDMFKDIHAFDLPQFDAATFSTTYENIKQKRTVEKTQEEEAYEKYKTEMREMSMAEKFSISLQDFECGNRDTYKMMHRIQQMLRTERNKRKLQDQNHTEKRDVISTSGVSMPVPKLDGSSEVPSCFVVSERDFFSTNYQKTKEEKIAEFLLRGSLENSKNFIETLVSGNLKTKLALLFATKNANHSNVYVANLLNRFDMPFMTAFSFWVENLTSAINGPIFYEESVVDSNYYAGVIVAHWREFVNASYMERLLHDRKKKKTKQMDFFLFAVGALYFMADGGILLQPKCQSQSSIPELFVGTSFYNRLIQGVRIWELPDGSADLKPALVHSKYIQFIPEIYSRGYHFDASTIADGKAAFKLCYTYRHQEAQNILFDAARKATYNSAEEKENIALTLFTEYVKRLVTPHTRAGCKRTTEVSTV